MAHSLDGVSASCPVALPCRRGALKSRCSFGSAGLQLACYNMSFVVPVKDTQRMEYQLPPPPVTAPNLGAHQVPVGVMQGTLTHVQAQDESHRWTQYHQQLWRQHVYMNGRTFRIVKTFVQIVQFFSSIRKQFEHKKSLFSCNSLSQELF